MLGLKQAGKEVGDISRAVNPVSVGERGEDGSNNLPRPRITPHLVLRLHIQSGGGRASVRGTGGVSSKPPQGGSEVWVSSMCEWMRQCGHIQHVLNVCISVTIA